VGQLTIDVSLSCVIIDGTRLLPHSDRRGLEGVTGKKTVDSEAMTVKN
jgi:hypothetical protein